MRPRALEHSLSETVLIGLLLAAAIWPGVTLGLGGVIAALHFTSLHAGYMVMAGVLARLSQPVAHAFSALVAIILAAEILLFSATGLHLNWFLVSLVFQKDAASQMGLTPAVFLSVPLFFLVLIALTARLRGRLWRVRSRPVRLAGVSIAAALLVQGLYGLQYSLGSPEAVMLSRSLPLFETLHPYYIRRAAALFAPARPEHAFSVTVRAPDVALSPDDMPKITEPRNVLLVVADSLRGQDIALDPTLAPNLMGWGLADGALFSLSHYSVSNCTHFSFFSLLTGRLPSAYMQPPATAAGYSLPAVLRQNGYGIRSVEAKSLDWYDVAAITLGADADRTVVADDAAVTDLTLAHLQGPRSEPRFDLAYYFGTHYPYDADGGETDLERYLASIRRLDQEVGRLMAGLNAMGHLEDTLVIVTADHGEEFTRLGSIGHAGRLSEAQVRVPLVILGAVGQGTDIRDHSDLRNFILHQLGATPAPKGPQGPVILANCAYAYPDAFSVLTGEGRADFWTAGGEIVPVPGGSLPQAATRAAALELVARLNAD